MYQKWLPKTQHSVAYLQHIINFMVIF